MRIVVIGLGNMGTSVVGALLVRGHRVLAVDRDPRKTGAMADGRSPVPERRADEIIRAALADGRLTTADAVPDLSGVDLTFVAVQTPANETACDYAALRRVLREIASRSPAGHVVLVASTLFPGAIRTECLPVLGKHRELVYEPVFLRAGYGIDEYLSPGKLILGVADPSAPPPMLPALFDSLTSTSPRYVTYEEAEWIKVVHNAFMSLKVAFVNEVGALCEQNGVDAARIIDLTFSETPAGRLLTRSHMMPGPPYSGPCLPKDADILQGLLQTTSDYDTWLAHGIGAALRESNLRYRELLVRRWLDAGRGDARPLGIVGLSFRPGYNEMRGSLALDFIRAADGAGLEWLAYDPAVCGVGADEYDLACRQDAELEGLFDRVRRPLAEVWSACSTVFVNRRLDEHERAEIATCQNTPVVIDVYHNDLPSARADAPEQMRPRPERRPPEPIVVR